MILSPIEEGIRAKIEQAGTPLKDWDIEIYRGILTGYNEAFIIDSKKRDQLIKDSPNSAEIIRPIIRGRDTLKFFSKGKGFYLIATFPSLNLDIERYPAIKKHLLSFGKERLEQTGKNYIINKEKISSRKKTSNKWFETQDQIGYWEQFDEPKIVWKRIGSVLRFSYDESNALCLDSTCFATGNDVKYLTGVLNSTICIKELLDNSPKTGTGDVITSVQALEPIRVPKATVEQRNEIAELVDNCIQILRENEGADISSFEKQIDNLVLNLYGLNDQEKEFIFNSTPQSLIN